MSGVLDLSAGRMTSTYNGATQFDTDAGGLFNKVPSAKITLSNYEILFPNLLYDIVYYLARTTVIIGESEFARHGSHSWTFITPGEYGPAGAGGFNIPDIVVGTVPAGTNYLDVRGSFSLTTAPSWFIASDGGQAILPQNVMTRLEGGSIVLSRDISLRRMISFHISGTDLILRRRMSVRSQGTNWLNLTTTFSTVNRFSTNRPIAQQNPYWFGVLGTNIDSVAFGARTVAEAQRGGSESSSLDAAAAGINYTCGFTSNIEITPCRIQS